MTRILCLYYSQTGQLERIARSFCSPLEESDQVDLVMHELEPVNPFPFPWPFTTFFNTFPETVYTDGVEIKPLPYSDEELADFVICSHMRAHPKTSAADAANKWQPKSSSWRSSKNL